MSTTVKLTAESLQAAAGLSAATPEKRAMWTGMSPGRCPNLHLFRTLTPKPPRLANKTPLGRNAARMRAKKITLTPVQPQKARRRPRPQTVEDYIGHDRYAPKP